MKPYLYLPFAVLSLTLSLSLSAALAASPDQGKSSTAPKASQAEPSPEAIKNSRDRGLFSESMDSVTGTTSVTVTKPTVLPKAKPEPKATSAVKVAPPTTAKVQGKPAATATVKAAGSTKLSTSAGDKGKHANLAGVKVSRPISAKTIQNGSGGSSAEPVSYHGKTTSDDNRVILTAWLNKKGDAPTYKVGEKMEVNVTATADCNLQIFDYDGSGSLTQIFPNDYQTNGFVKAGESVRIGGPDSQFDYEVSGKGGAEKIFVYAYPASTQSPLTVAFNPVPYTPFRSAKLTLEQYRDLVNNSRVFFSREVKVVPKNGVKPVAAPASSAANKIELSFKVETK